MAERTLFQKIVALCGLEQPLPPPAPPATTPRTSAPSASAPANPAPAAAADSNANVEGIPAAAKKRVVKIAKLLGELENRAAAQGIASNEVIELRQIGEVYLPRLLQSYAEIPPEHRAEIFRSTGRSASFLLGEKLDRIVDRLGEISRALAQGHLDAFSDNMRFIDTRYGSADSPFG